MRNEGSGGVFNIGSQQAGAIYNAGRDQTIHGGGGTLATEAVNAIADLRAALESLPLTVADRREADEALSDASAEAVSAEPNKGKVAARVERALDIVERAGDLAGAGAKLAAPVATLAGWLGPAGAALLKLIF